MIDAAILPLLKRVIERPARVLAARGVGADQITLAGFAIGMAAVPALASGLFWIGLLCLILNRLADGLDGAVARLGVPTDRGAFLDIAMDFVFYAVFPLGFAIYDPAANGVAAAVLIASFVGTGSSFLAFSIIAEKRGLASAHYPSKGIYYLGGLTEGTETIAVFVAMCLWPTSFAVLAYVFAAMCLVTTLTRWLAGWRAFS
ncbi:CDP-alcohol phosphatidyltransferase family protein [Marivita sp. S2033]|uniref:CDP-alcohol phosphatidyltransferase family protein n=1 Tax=Marivita sp. S2033 TaxID=3373187 RepID=UPI003981A917